MFARRVRFFPVLAVFAVGGFVPFASALAFEEKDCGRIETVQQTYSLDLKSSDSVEEGRRKATNEIVKEAIAQVVGYEVKSDREQNTKVINNSAEERFQGAEKALLAGLARIKVTDEKRTALPQGQTLTITADVKVCVPKADAIRKAEREKEERAANPPKVVDPEKAVWFNPGSGQAQVWYSRADDGVYKFYDNAGFDPNTGDPLQPVSAKVLREWRAFEERHKRELQARAEAEKRAAEQKILIQERERVAAARRAELLTHARESCDKLAANPNDPEKPRSISGASFDDLKRDVDQAIEACEAAIQTDPRDLRLKYQLARAYSVREPKRSLGIFKYLCTQGYRAAFDNYGWALLDTRVRLNDLRGAINYFKRGAQLGDTDAMVSLAGFVERGKVPGLTVVDAIALYRRAESLGNTDATKFLQPLLEAQQEAQRKELEVQQRAERQRQQELQDAQAIMGLFGGMVGRMR